jgi:hypothetical protein
MIIKFSTIAYIYVFDWPLIATGLDFPLSMKL